MNPLLPTAVCPLRHAAEGIATSRGGMTSHAAVVARGWGKPCVCGCESLQIDEEKKVWKAVSHFEIWNRVETWRHLEGDRLFANFRMHEPPITSVSDIYIGLHP